ncbi:ABC transporter ATP-binding protein [Owenweeksia hongkongensis]|uniref:ABC transporter ATP-binding protein n=1 Tax=Owenweeksia hongkongensis TaxID=253245 RepID=UPI003A902BD8
MEVILENLSKSFGKQNVIENVDYIFHQGNRHAILGGNGSGKSTLLQMIYGSLTPSSGNLNYRLRGTSIKQEDVVFKTTLASPYLELIEELTAKEFLTFYSKFRNFRKGISPDEILEYCYLTASAKKEIRNFSSGMKQRLRLSLALFTESEMVLLDEPISNLDPQGMEWYQKLVNEQLVERTLIVGSNFDEREMGFCPHRLEIQSLNRS